MVAPDALRLLIVAAFPVLPPVAGGKIRIVKLARGLAKLGVEVTVVTPFHPRQSQSVVEREPFGVRAVPYPFAAPFLLTDRPFPYGYLVSFHPGYRALARLRLDDFDVCQIEHPAFGDVGAGARAPLVYDAQNVEYDYVRSECEAGRVERLVGRRLFALEERLAQGAAHVFACSRGDRDRLTELYALPPERTSVLPNGVDLPEAGSAPMPALERFPGLERFRRRALFSGSAVPHNFAAARAIVERLAPALSDEAAFVIHGPCGAPVAGRAPANVFFDPAEEDLEAWAAPGTVAINPVERGSGTSMKVLQYLACGLPVLSTEFGMRGYEDLRALVETAPLEEFPAALRRDHALPAGAREALDAYSWDRIAGTALSVYESLREAPQPHSA